ncbi:calcium-binding protein [Novosphingobium huizhouense]|uniref:calcium-binding protein n=1 Tax=Novosphingobium huizhouense TaxID=2866625 RepID=UPI001CD8DEC2|nr:calcium-binding protein [Novosphingobium huizhouense]
MTYARFGSEFVANQTTAGSQQLGGILALGGGKFAVEYYDSSNPQAQHYDVRVFDGATGGAETNLGKSAPAIVLADGRLVELVVDDVAYGKISAQFLTSSFAASGKPVDLVVDPTGGFYRLISPAAVALGNGGFAISLALQPVGGYTTQIYAQVFDAAGKPVGSGVEVGDAGINGESDMAVLSDGRIAVFNHDAHQVSIFAADLSGTPAVVTIDTTQAQGSSIPLEAKIVALKNGAFAVVWDENLSSGGYISIGALHAQVFDAAGKAASEDIVVSPTGPAKVDSFDLAALPNGDFAIAWAKRIGDGSDIALRTFNASGDEIGLEQVVNTTTTGLQYNPRIGVLANGSMVIGWTDASSSADPFVSGDVRMQVLASHAGRTYTGTGGADMLTGTGKDDTLIGLAGNDVLDGRGGFDTVSYAAAGAGVVVSLAATVAHDTIGAGVDKLVSIEGLIGSAFDDRLGGNSAANVLSGGAGADTLRGLGGNDRLEGGLGNDTLDGGAGADLMIGGRGSDTYYVDNAGDVVIESSFRDPVSGKPLGGNDRVVSSVDYRLPDLVERLTLTGSADLHAFGNGLDNVIVGNSGDNFIFGAGGSDRLTGGGGADTFELIQLGRGAPTITDFTPGTDHLALKAFFAFYDREGSTLSDAELAYGTKARTPDQHLIYNATTGTLFYDPDGSGAQAQFRIAVLENHADLHGSDIVVI